MSMETYTHKCIKSSCANTYQDSDPDAYYCQSCNEERKKIALQIDEQFANRPKKQPVSALKEYEDSPKIRGFQIVKE